MKIYIILLWHVCAYSAAANDPVLIANLPHGSDIPIAENSALGAVVFDVNYADNDTGQTHTFTLASSPVSGMTYFEINSSDGIISTSTTNNINYEGLTSMSFNLSVTVSDGTDTDTQDLIVTIVDVNEAPSFSPLAYSITADEGAANTILGTPSFGVSDPDALDSYTYSLDCGTETGYFLMDSSSGEVRYQSDYDVDSGSLSSSVSCTITVTDSGGLTDTAALSITINNINDNTPQFIPSYYTFYVSYYVGISSSIGTTTASDADTGTYGTLSYSIYQVNLGDNYFGVTSNGDIFTQMGLSPLGYGVSRTISIIATDSGGLNATATVVIFISDTTTSSTTTTVTYQTFADDTKNVGWLVPCIILIVAIGLFMAWLICSCRGENSWSNMKRLIFPKQMPYRRWNVPWKPELPDYIRDIQDPIESVRKPPPPKSAQIWRAEVSAPGNLHRTSVSESNRRFEFWKESNFNEK